MNSLFSFARHKSSIINSPVPIILLLLLCCIAGCRGGHPAEKEEADDLQQNKGQRRTGRIDTVQFQLPTSSTVARTWDSSIAKRTVCQEPGSKAKNRGSPERARTHREVIGRQGRPHCLQPAYH